MTAVHESLRAPIENNDNGAPREDRVRYGVPRTLENKKDAYGESHVIVVLGGLVVTALFLIVLLACAFYELWFGVHPWTGGY